VKQTQYDWLYVIGSVCPATGQTVGMISPHLDTAIVNVFLEQMARQVPPDAHVVLIWDQAGFHTAGRLKVPPNMTLVPLPPYSPELNPTENLWHYLRSHHWSNRAYADWDALDKAACEAWQKTCLNAELIKSVCRAPYAEQRSLKQ
jgi:transposase